MVFVEGNGEVSGDAIKIVATDIIAMDKVREKFAKRVFFLLNTDEVDEKKMTTLREVMEKNKGNCNCYFNVIGKEFADQQVYVSRKYCCKPDRPVYRKRQVNPGKKCNKGFSIIIHKGEVHEAS